MLMATLKGRELILRMIRYVYAKSQYFIVTAILKEMQRQWVVSSPCCHYRVGWQRQAVLWWSRYWPQHLLKHQGWFKDINNAGALVHRRTSWLGLLIIPVVFIATVRAVGFSLLWIHSLISISPSGTSWSSFTLKI